MRDKRIAVLIDGSNFYETAKQLHFAIDYARLRDYFSSYDVHRIQFFTGLEDRETGSNKNLHDMVHWMQCNGFLTITKEVKVYGDKKKANMDVELACEAMVVADLVEEIHLFTGDGDFTYLIKMVQHRGVRVVLYSSLKAKMCSDLLRRTADQFIELEDIKNQMAKQAVINTVVAQTVVKRRSFFKT